MTYARLPGSPSARVLEYVRQHGPITRNEVEKALDLPYQQSANIFNHLSREGVIKKQGSRRMVPRGRESALWVVAEIAECGTRSYTIVERALSSLSDLAKVWHPSFQPSSPVGA